jgi:adenine-specific DNA-methyltransferase
MDTKQKTLGQYFTTHESLLQKVYEFIQNEPDVILEPSVGQCNLVTYILQYRPHIHFDMYEIDSTITPLEPITKDQIIWGDFIEYKKNKKYKTIIGNPPYVSRPRKCNLYIEFIKECVDLLEEDGELIFIVPSEVFKLTSSAKLLQNMMNYGSFTHIYHPHDELLFKGASVDTLIFRYQKTMGLSNEILYNGEVKYIKNTNGMITFDDENVDISQKRFIQDYFDIYVGIVSGKEEVFKNDELGNIRVLNGEDKMDKYIFIEDFPTTNEVINQYMMQHKDVLINRQIRSFTEKNWWEWGALRNTQIMRESIGEDCIYVSTITRKSNVAFRGKIGYFGGSLLMMKPKIDGIDMDEVVEIINSNEFRKNFIFSNRFKISHRQLSNSYF